MHNIFTHFISRGDSVESNKRLAYAAWFTEAVPLHEFDGDERLFCEFLDYCVSLGIPVTHKYLQVWLHTELREILHKTQIRVLGCEALSFDDPVSFETLYRITSNVMSDNFVTLETLESDVDDFKIEVASFFKERRSERLTSALASTFELLNDTDSSEDASDYAIDTLNTIRDIYDSAKIEDLDTETESRRKMEETMRVITNWGIPAIDNDSQGVYSTQLVGIEAQPGTGKTRLAIGTLCYRAITEFKHNVLFLALEQKEVEIYAMLLAHHIFRLFNIQVSDAMILRNNIPDEIRAQYEAAKYDLFESGKYGKFVAKELDLYVETFITKLRTLDKLQGPFDLICIDYMGLIESKPAKFQKALNEYEIIKTAFKQFKRYLRKTDKSGVAISQFNREGIQAGKADKEITTDMAQGGIAVYRNTDYNVSMSMSETMRLQQKRRFSQPKVRSSTGFNNFIADTRLGFCYFRQVVQKTV